MPTTPDGSTMPRDTAMRLTMLIATLAVPVHLIGLLSPSIYRDPAVLIPQNLGTDLVTLFVGIPLLIAGAVGVRRGSLRGRMIWLAALGYLVYAYGMYALSVRWNELFLAYVALFGLSLYAFILGFMGTDPAQVRAATAPGAPRRSVAAYLLTVAVLVAAVWLGEEIGALLRGTVPPTVVQFETPTNSVHVFDLAVVLPAMVLAGVLLLRDRPWGYLLAGVLLVKATTIGLWVLAMIWFSARAGIATPLPYTTLFGLLTLCGALLAGWYLARLRS